MTKANVQISDIVEPAEVSALREFMIEHGLTPPLPDGFQLTDEKATQIYQRATKFQYARGLDTPRSMGCAKSQYGTRPTRTRSSIGAPTAPYRRQPRKAHAGYVLAACLAGALAVGLGLRFGPANLQVATHTAAQNEVMIAGLPPLEFAGIDLTDVGSIPSAADALAAAQRTAAAAGQEGEGDVQFISRLTHLFECENVNANGACEGMLITLVRDDSWAMPDGAARIDETRGPTVGLDQFAKLPLTSEIVGETHSWEYPAPTEIVHEGGGQLTPWIVDELPRDPAALRPALIRYVGGCEHNQIEDLCLLDAITYLYRMNVIPNDLAAAIWETVGDSPYLHNLGETTDRLGRPTLAFAANPFPTVDNLYVYLVSPTNGRLIGWEEIAVNDPVHPTAEPTVIGFDYWLDARFVENVGDHPEV